MPSSSIQAQADYSDRFRSHFRALPVEIRAEVLANVGFNPRVLCDIYDSDPQMREAVSADVLWRSFMPAPTDGSSRIQAYQHRRAAGPRERSFFINFIYGDHLNSFPIRKQLCCVEKIGNYLAKYPKEGDEDCRVAVLKKFGELLCLNRMSVNRESHPTVTFDEPGPLCHRRELYRDHKWWSGSPADYEEQTQIFSAWGFPEKRSRPEHHDLGIYHENPEYWLRTVNANEEFPSIFRSEPEFIGSIYSTNPPSVTYGKSYTYTELPHVVRNERELSENLYERESHWFSFYSEGGSAASSSSGHSILNRAQRIARSERYERTKNWVKTLLSPDVYDVSGLSVFVAKNIIDPKLLSFLPERFRSDDELVREVVKRDSQAYLYLSDEQKEGRELARLFINSDASGFSSLPERLKDDPSFVGDMYSDLVRENRHCEALAFSTDAMMEGRILIFQAEEVFYQQTNLEAFKNAVARGDWTGRFQNQMASIGSCPDRGACQDAVSIAGHRLQSFELLFSNIVNFIMLRAEMNHQARRETLLRLITYQPRIGITLGQCESLTIDEREDYLRQALEHCRASEHSSVAAVLREKIQWFESQKSNGCQIV